MDSGSPSLQSSSGGDEDYDSHHAFPPPPPPPPPLFFNPNSYQTHLLPSSPFYDFPSDYTFNNPSNAGTSEPAAAEPTQNQIPIRSSGVLHPKATTKKRTRASRRAPTTVLTTDTTNFRAMVQEFTGIPSPPFTAGGSSYSRRFDLFNLVKTTSSTPSILETSGSGLYSSRVVKTQAAIRADLDAPHESTSPLFVSAALQNDETWRTNSSGTPGGEFHRSLLQ